ncbi:MAG: molybdopterin-dependent oxidoreductase, partial [Vicinamibacterales bacterium]
MPRPSQRDDPGWGHSTVRTACPLDCPDCCTLEVTVEQGRVVKIDGGDANPVTRKYICAKVRRFGERMYGEDRLLYPAVRSGAKGSGTFVRVTWEEALDQIARRMEAIRDSAGAEAILPFCYGGSNGLLTQDTNDARLFRGFGTSRLERTVCAAPTGAANQALYGKMAGVTYQDYVHAKLIVLWGVNPSASGIHLVPFIKDARNRGAQLVVIDPRATSLARQADLHIAPRPGTDLPLALALHRYLFARGDGTAFLAEHARGVEGLRARAEEWTIERAARTCEIDPAELERFAALYANASPALIRCGWGLERNRNGGAAAAAVMALPAVGGKFGLRGGGFSMSNSSAFGIKSAAWMDETPEPSTRLVNMNHLGRALLDYTDPPVQMLFVYNCNPLATMPDQNRVLKGLQREDLFTVVYEQVFTDTTRYADVILPATTFLENYDIAKGYGPITLQLVRPVVEPSGEARPNAEVFSDLASRLGIGE